MEGSLPSAFKRRRLDDLQFGTGCGTSAHVQASAAGLPGMAGAADSETSDALTQLRAAAKAAADLVVASMEAGPSSSSSSSSAAPAPATAADGGVAAAIRGEVREGRDPQPCPDVDSPAGASSGDPEGERDRLEVQAFLTRAGVAQYLPNFIRSGFDMMAAVRAMDEKDMIEECGMALEHAKILQRELSLPADAPPAQATVAMAPAHMGSTCLQAASLQQTHCSNFSGHPAAERQLASTQAQRRDLHALQVPALRSEALVPMAATLPQSQGHAPHNLYGANGWAAETNGLVAMQALPQQQGGHNHAGFDQAMALQQGGHSHAGFGGQAMAPQQGGHSHAGFDQAMALQQGGHNHAGFDQAMMLQQGGHSHASSEQAMVQQQQGGHGQASLEGPVQLYGQFYALAQLAEESAQMNASAAAFCANPSAEPFQIAAVAEAAQQAAQRAAWAASAMTAQQAGAAAGDGDTSWMGTMKQVAQQAADAAEQAAQNCKVSAAGVREACLDAFKSRKSKVPCKNHLVGRCSKGMACEFSHDPVDMQPRPLMLKSMKQCIFHAKGNCVRGPACPFSHGEEESAEIEKYVDILRKEKKQVGGGYRRS